MGIVEFFIPLGLSREELNVLLKAIDYFSYASSVLEYGEHTAECQSIRDKVMCHIGTREEFYKYMEKKRKEIKKQKKKKVEKSK